jgi:hypothetical protein
MRPLVHHVPSFADRSYLTLALSRKAAARHERTLEGVGCTLREARGQGAVRASPLLEECASARP